MGFRAIAGATMIGLVGSLTPNHSDIRDWVERAAPIPNIQNELPVRLRPK